MLSFAIGLALAGSLLVICIALYLFVCSVVFVGLGVSKASKTQKADKSQATEESLEDVSPWNQMSAFKKVLLVLFYVGAFYGIYFFMNGGDLSFIADIPLWTDLTTDQKIQVFVGVGVSALVVNLLIKGRHSKS